MTQTKNSRLRLAAILLLGLALGLILADRLRPSSAPPAPAIPEPVASARPAHAEPISDSRRNAIVRAVEAVEPAVVSVNTYTVEEQPVRYRDPFFDFYFPFAVLRQKVPGIGSGFIVREDGLILTNHHVVAGAASVSVTLPDKRQFEVKNIRRQILSDPETDVALIRLQDTRGLPAVRLGDSDQTIIGEWAIAIGNPFGLNIRDPKPTVTVGVISATDRDVRTGDRRTYRNMLQTDAAINRGNSGGPLVNGSGEVIGINTVIFTEGEGGSIGIGFAIPSNKAKRVMEELLRYGRTREFWTGISVVGINRWMAARLGLESTAGALISEVEPNSPGQRAGLRPGDVIVEVNGRSVKDDEEALDAFGGATGGETFGLSVLRDGQRLEARLQLEQDPRRR